MNRIYFTECKQRYKISFTFRNKQEGNYEFGLCSSFNSRAKRGTSN